jgi:hypothetical protein
VHRAAFAGRRLRRFFAKEQSTVARFVRQDWLFILFFALGTGLRAAAVAAYRPALFAGDSGSYLRQAIDLRPNPVRPLGYPIFVRAVGLVDENLVVLAGAQHVLVLGLACALYGSLRRLQVSRWLSALAIAPLLLDGEQILFEHYVLSDVLFEAFLVVGCVLLLRKQPLMPLISGAAGAAFAGATLTRGVGLFTIVPAVLAAASLAAARPRRARLVSALALTAAFALCVGAYATWFHSRYGTFAISNAGPRFFYGRVATFVDCRELSLPEYERPLCPLARVGDRPSSHTFSWSRFNAFDPPPGESRNDVAADFNRRVVIHQPVTYLRVVGGDFLRSFAPTKQMAYEREHIEYWRFPDTRRFLAAQTRKLELLVNKDALDRFGTFDRQVDGGLASFLRSYQAVVDTPGPLLGIGLLIALFGTLGFGCMRKSGLRSASFLFAGTGLAVCLGSVAVSHLSIRYQLPQVALLPPAAAVALTGLRRPKLTLPRMAP